MINCLLILQFFWLIFYFIRIFFMIYSSNALKEQITCILPWGYRKKARIKV
uniref:Uncharacterized protein n=1 Tax=Rhizophora mucronata TaxID=61149 RepID=A0A2P2NM55_RHIMU